MPGYGSTFVNASWITASEYKHWSNIRMFQNEHIFRVFQWLDLHEARIVPADSFPIESTYYNPHRFSILSTSPSVSGTPMSVSPIPDIVEMSVQAPLPRYSLDWSTTFSYPSDLQTFSNYIVISDSDDEPESAWISGGLRELMKKEGEPELALVGNNLKLEQSSNIIYIMFLR